MRSIKSRSRLASSNTRRPDFAVNSFSNRPFLQFIRSAKCALAPPLRERPSDPGLQRAARLPFPREWLGRSLRPANHALAQIRELWQYAGRDELPPDAPLQAQVEAFGILRIDVPLSAKRQFQLFLLRTFPRPRRYPRLPRCRSALGSPLYARPASP